VKLVFVNRFFHPDLAPTGRLAALVAFDLAAQGREVRAVTSRQRYEDHEAALPAEEVVRGVRIHRVWTTRFGRGTLAGRALDYLTFYVSVTLALLRRLRRGDVVVAMTDPPLLSVCVAFAAWLRGARLVNWLQDIFPETAERSGIRALGGPAGALARGLRNWSVRRAACNVVLGERMAAELERLVPGARRAVVPNWADGGEILPLPAAESPLRKAWGLEGKFVVGYSGNFGRVHDCDTLLAAARLLAKEAGIVFSVTGGGYRFGHLRAAGLPNIAVRGYLPAEMLSEGLAACDVHLVSLLPAFEGLVVPSKFYSIAAAGRAVIFVGDRRGEIARLLEKHGCGVTVAPGDGVGLAAAIRELRAAPDQLHAMGERARAAFERHWDEPIALGRWREILEGVGR
jgi:colanic acid biosynthesis glycosyl transferase WcaI